MKFTMQSTRAVSQRKALALTLCGALLLPGCSVKKFAVNKLGDALANGGTTFASDDDLELIRDAVPFSLKLMEGLLAENPKHRGLLLAAASGFTQYAYAFVQQEAEEAESRDVAAGDLLRARARRLYLRARNYALRGLETRHAGFESALRENPKTALRKATAADVPLLYWAAASWGAAISVSKDDPDLIADQLIVEALIDRAMQLDEKFENGALHGFLIAYESARQGVKGDPAHRARRHFERVVDLTGGKLAGPYVTLAESVAVAQQDRAAFEELLQKALAINADEKPEWRVANLVMQKRARWLLSRGDQLFVEERAAKSAQKE